MLSIMNDVSLSLIEHFCEILMAMNAKGNNFDYYLKCIPRHDFNTGMSLFCQISMVIL